VNPKITDRPTVPEVLPLVRALYAREGGSVGCCLHIVLEDGNFEDGNVQHCYEYAIERGHEDCRVLAGILLLMSKTQRKKLSHLAYV
jgi:hypothetical protein